MGRGDFCLLPVSGICSSRHTQIQISLLALYSRSDEGENVLDLVFGAYGETSDGVKKLLDQLVESRVTSLGLRMGSLEASKEMRQVTDYLRPLCVLMSSAFWI